MRHDIAIAEQDNFRGALAWALRSGPWGSGSRSHPRWSGSGSPMTRAKECAGSSVS